VRLVAAVSSHEAEPIPSFPVSMTLMGRTSDTAAIEAVTSSPRSPASDGVRATSSPGAVSASGVCANVYPGFLQSSGFISMNFDRIRMPPRGYLAIW